MAVCDANGFLLAFARSDGAPLRTIAIAQDKAYTSARMGVTTTAFHERLLNEELQSRDFSDERFTPLPGGAPLCDPLGKLYGALGVSGLAPAEDQTVATAISRRWSRSEQQ